jgi:LacI family transcriptional regulator
MGTNLAKVAAHAGVSLATASRVLNGGARVVTASLRARVLAAAEELQYVPNAQAQALARASNAIVGVLVHDMSDPYFSEILRGIQRVATNANRLVITSNSYRDPERELEYVRLLHAHRVDALILAGSGLDTLEYSQQMAQHIAVFTNTGGRVVLIGRHQIPGDTVLPDNFGGAYQLATYFAQLGHRRIGVIAGPALLTTTHDRLEGFRCGLVAAGIVLHNHEVVTGDFSRDSGVAATHQLLTQSPDITAIFAHNDVMAVGALVALRQRGIAVPQQMTVAGFDDIPVAEDVTPALTTVRVPMVELGVHAMTMALSTTSAAFRTVQCATELVIRASSDIVAPRA